MPFRAHCVPLPSTFGVRTSHPSFTFHSHCVHACSRYFTLFYALLRYFYGGGEGWSPSSAPSAVQPPTLFVLSTLNPYVRSTQGLPHWRPIDRVLSCSLVFSPVHSKIDNRHSTFDMIATRHTETHAAHTKNTRKTHETHRKITETHGKTRIFFLPRNARMAELGGQNSYSSCPKLLRRSPLR